MLRFLNIVFLLIAFVMKAQWSSNSSVNNVICNLSNNQQNPKIVTDGNGGAIVVWEDYRNDNTQTYADIYAQRIDKNGIIKWAINGIPICTDLSHQSNPNIDFNNGNIVIIWNDYRNGNVDIYAQMIDTLGNIKWTSNGVPVISKVFSQKDGKVVLDNNNNAYVVFQDSSAGQWDIYAQKLNINGIQQWGTNGAVVCNAGNNQINPRVELSNNGIYVVWQDKRNGVDYDIYAQRLDANGNRKWNVANNGIWVCSIAGTQNNPKIDPMPKGFIVAWQDLRNGSDYDIYAQYIDSTGIAQWTTNGKVICNATNNQSAVDLKTNNIDGSYIVWKDKRGGTYYDIYMQKISYTGNISWANNGIVISNANYDQVNPNIAIDPSGDALIVWQDSSNNEWDIYASKVSNSGNVLWTTVVSNAPNTQTNPKNISDNNGGTIVVWQDKRNNTTTKWDIYAQKVFSNGSLNSITEIVKYPKLKIWPNPSSSFIHIQLMDAFENNYSIQIFNLLGECVYENKLLSLTSTINTNLFPEGVYLIKIFNNDQFILSSKFIKQWLEQNY